MLPYREDRAYKINSRRIYKMFFGATQLGGVSKKTNYGWESG